MTTHKKLGLWLTASIAGALFFAAPRSEADTLFATDGILPTSSLGSHSGYTLPETGIISGAQGIAFDPNGEIVASFYGGFVNRYSAAGAFLSTLGHYGSGNGGVAVDFNGDIYLSHGNQVLKLNSIGAIQSTIATLTAPQGVTVDTAGNLYVADSATNSVHKYAPGGTLLATFTSGLDAPVAVALTSSGNLLVSNYNISTISHLLPDGTSLGNFGSGLSNPWGIALVANGNILVANRGNSTISEFDSAGATVTTYGNPGFIPTYLATPVVGVPEPSAFGMVALGAFGLVALRRRR